LAAALFSCCRLTWSKPLPKLDHQDLLQFSTALLARGGIPLAAAETVAALLVKADLRGYPGHGVTRIAPYLGWLKDGTIRTDSTIEIVREGKISAVIDANHTIGQMAAMRATSLAIQKAREHGAGIVCLRHAGHIGRLADYIEMAANDGLIAVGAVSVGAGSTTLYGGMERIVGTNPFAFGIPVRNGAPIVADFATAAMSMGEIQKRAAAKEILPEGVMLDGAGNSTRDFQTFRGPPRGVLLPFGGYKGSAVALLTEILGGVLTGNGLGRDWWKRGGHAVNGVFVEVLSVEEFGSAEAFYDKVDELIAVTKSTRPADGHAEVFLPGERSRRAEAEQRRSGVSVDEKTWNQLAELAAELRVSLPQPK
jgi:hydroxycarboxylate dehydrogenase B